MNRNLMMPYFCQAEHQSFFLKINEQENLCLHKRNAQSEWGEAEILHQDCRHFAAAPDADDCVHVIAADSTGKLTYFVITADQTRRASFFVKESRGFFVLSFTASGVGYFFCSEEKSGKLVVAKYLPDSGWKEDFSLAASYSVPVCLSIDNDGGLHLILHDLTNGSLNYTFHSQKVQKWANPFRLDSSLQMSSLPALWIDAGENLHFAWYIPRNNTICYRIKKAGGWPTGGWQPEHYLPLDTAPSILSFYEESQSTKLWFFIGDNEVAMFYNENEEWRQIKVETDFHLPVRQGTLGREFFNVASAVPTSELYFSPVPAQTKDPGEEQKDEQDENLLGQIMQLMEEKRSLKALLQKKEESLAQYRIMLERTHESSNKQRSEWKESSNKIEAEMRRLVEELQKHERENKSLKEQVERAQRKIISQDATIKEGHAEVLTLRVKLEHYRQQEGELKATIGYLEKELAKRKGIWEKISSALHNKE